jgi:hypothetical protein
LTLNTDDAIAFRALDSGFGFIYTSGLRGVDQLNQAATIQAKLLEHGMDETMPVALVENGNAD